MFTGSINHTIFKMANYIFYMILDTLLFSYGISILFAAPLPTSGEVGCLNTV